jgi:hypothetical protein
MTSDQGIIYFIFYFILPSNEKKRYTRFNKNKTRGIYKLSNGLKE